LIASCFAVAQPVVWNLSCSDVNLRYYSRNERWVLRALAWLSRRPAAILANSTASIRWHQLLGYRPRRWELVPNGFDVDRFRPDPAAYLRVRRELGLPAEAVLVGLVARLDPIKDHENFLAAAVRVVAKHPEVHFVVVGRGVETLAGVVAAHGLYSSTHLLGERRDVDRLLPGFHIVCVSSASESCPNVLGEAMAAGVPCVTTDVGDARIMLSDTGLVVPRRNPAALADALIDLIDRGPEARMALGRAARARIAAEYALPRIIERYQAIYSDIAGVKSRSCIS
jgi:glycosyltransferase involved in cell wall biosynthesis